MKKLITALLAFGLVLGLTACTNKPKEEIKDEVTIVKVGVVGSYNEQWDTVNEILAKDNIKVELVAFSDYATPNRALADKDIDLNAFQHHAFLENDCTKNGYDLVAIGDTLIAPLGIYNNKDKISSVDQFKDGDIIAIPSDATNGGRALKLLEEVGLIVCDPATGWLPTVADITEYKVNIQIMELESAMLANTLPDVTAALINGGNAFTAGLNPTKDTIYIETVGDNAARLKNIIAARAEDKDNEIYLKIVAAYQTDEVAAKLDEAYDGAFIPAWK